MSVEQIPGLLRATYDGPVFGAGVAFRPVNDPHIGEPLTPEQVDVFVADSLPHLLGSAATLVSTMEVAVGEAFPKIPSRIRKMLIAGAVGKTICFVHAITNRNELPESLGEVGSERMGPARTVFDMYTSNTTMDGRDLPMYWAIKHRYRGAAIPDEHSEEAKQRSFLLNDMHDTFPIFAAEDDVEALEELFGLKVLDNELSLFDFAEEYHSLPEEERAEFLTSNAGRIADLMVETAGFPTVSTSSYSRYRRFANPKLPSIAEMHANPVIARLVQMCNTMARVLDEVGDAPEDATGKGGDQGSRTINPFNQYNQELVNELCKRGNTPPEQLETIQEAFRNFNEDRETHGATITNIFTKTVRDYTLELFETMPQYKEYLRFSMRVLEISYVNKRGDIELAGLAG